MNIHKKIIDLVNTVEYTATYNNLKSELEGIQIISYNLFFRLVRILISIM